MERRKATPFAAVSFLKAMRGMFAWAVENDHVPSDPTMGVKGKVPKTAGFAVWTEDEIDRFEERWPIGTRERLALTILLYTGLRRGDAARLGRQHVQNGVITLNTEKTDTRVTIPILPVLADVIAATKTGDLTFIAKADGAGMTKESFGNWFGEACRAAGVASSAHGLRKAGANRAAENGATTSELDAIFGWEDGKMASLYTRAANRKKMAQRAMGSSAGTIQEHLCPNPHKG